MPDSIHAFCSYCGTAFVEQCWPRKCERCGQFTYRNPTPVVAVVLPVDAGLLMVRRAIEPKKGMLTFPGGYIDYGEGWRQAGARELREEAGVQIDPDELQPFNIISTSKGHMVMIFALARWRCSADLPTFAATPEASERVIITGPQDLAFPQDDEVARDYFDTRTRP